MIKVIKILLKTLTIKYQDFLKIKNQKINLKKKEEREVKNMIEIVDMRKIHMIDMIERGKFIEEIGD